MTRAKLGVYSPEYESRAAWRRAGAVRMAAEGLRSGEIARRLGISKNSVQKALRTVRKQGVESVSG
jgi:transposase